MPRGAPQGPAPFPSSLFFVNPQSPGDQVWDKKGNTVLDGEVNHKVGFKERRKKGDHPGQGSQEGSGRTWGRPVAWMVNLGLAISQELEGRQGCWWAFCVSQGVPQAPSWLVRGEGAACGGSWVQVRWE